MLKYFSDIWNKPNSIPKWSFCYALMVLSVMAAYDNFGMI